MSPDKLPPFWGCDSTGEMFPKVSFEPSAAGPWFVREADYMELRAEVVRLREALEGIAGHAGQTLIGDGRYDEGANAAFEQCAGIAARALAQQPAQAEGE